MKQSPVIHGIKAGLVLTLILGGVYFLDVNYYFNPILRFCIIAFIPFIWMVKATRAIKENSKDGLDKKTAIRTAFIVWIIAMVFYHIFYHFTFTYDEQLIELLRERVAESQGEKGAKLVGPPDIVGTFKTFLFMLLPGFFFSFMVASFLKNK